MLKLPDVKQCAHDGYLEAVKGQEGEGCRMWGRLQVNKVAGNFHFAAGKSYQQVGRLGEGGGGTGGGIGGEGLVQRPRGEAAPIALGFRGLGARG
jgi:hypothetical protein